MAGPLNLDPKTVLQHLLEAQTYQRENPALCKVDSHSPFLWER